jgi:hypothetical protein
VGVLLVINYNKIEGEHERRTWRAKGPVIRPVRGRLYPAHKIKGGCSLHSKHACFETSGMPDAPSILKDNANPVTRKAFVKR